jgi:phosphatidylglycerol:prolipoprotein diacylglycerol transferase
MTKDERRMTKAWLFCHPTFIMYPIIRLGPFTLSTYTLLLDLGIVAGLAWLAWSARWTRGAVEASRWLNAGLAAVAAGLIGARIGYVLVNWAYFHDHLDEAWQIWLGGLSWHVGLFAGVLMLVVWTRWRGLPLGDLADAAAPGLLLGLAAGWTGCLMAGCNYGREVFEPTSPWRRLAAELPDIYGVVAPRLVTQVLAAGWALAVLVLLLLLRRAALTSGGRFLLAVGLFSLGLFAVGFTRGDAAPPVGAWRLDQVVDLGIAVAALLGLIVMPALQRSRMASWRPLLRNAKGAKNAKAS